jgi:hypothetical protein
VDSLNAKFKGKVKELSNEITKQIPHYFNDDKRELMQNIAYLFDPKMFKSYNNINATAAHGNNVVDKVLNHFKTKKLRIGATDSHRTYKWKKLDINKFKIQYNNCKPMLFSHKNVYPDNMAQRLLFIVLQMEEKKNMFDMILLVMKRVMIYFSGIIDIERQNGIKKWMLNARRESMLTTKLDMILRIYCNRPNCNDDEYLHPWLMEVAKKWYNAANRQIECDELDAM